MSDKLIDSLREMAFAHIDLADAEIRPAVIQLAARLVRLPDVASFAPTRATYLLLLLQEMEIHSNDDINQSSGFDVYTLDTIRRMIDYRLATGQWPEQIQ